MGDRCILEDIVQQRTDDGHFAFGIRKRRIHEILHDQSCVDTVDNVRFSCLAFLSFVCLLSKFQCPFDSWSPQKATVRNVNAMQHAALDLIILYTDALLTQEGDQLLR